ncbi:PhzF family phenazine biosynthesis protein [Egibacter rhizosphaerae]|uniref:PhzF family phenazine biosynthesis protein n=1 Tax=Egibacter rhizosphaerae TaxID=1670831 RepID=A0A411YGQ8_9ACTN|nr:PhzF family phenazine biosynthesis protein [Egibacter rhizosphaerae]QBI20430.1 PhzF family phenazine biosynthesis protein [Egibacter rhizosphaerae]
MRRRFLQLDVFSPVPYLGNPLAVVVDAEGLDTDDMRRIARWTNLSETVFLLPPDAPGADYRVRIFNLGSELPFAGHPTLGACRAWLESGGRPRDADAVVQECGAGLVTVRRTDAELAFAAPPLKRSGPVDEALVADLAAVLRLDPADIVDAQWVDNGPGWVAVLLGTADEVLAVEPDASAVAETPSDIGIVGPYPPDSPFAFEVRALFADGEGNLREDPVTGSLNASLGQWLLASGRATAPYTASQGTRMHRAGRPRIDADADGSVWVGGPTHVCVDGAIEA